MYGKYLMPMQDGLADENLDKIVNRPEWAKDVYRNTLFSRVWDDIADLYND